MEAYRISVAIAMSSNHSAVLSALSSGLLGVHAKVKDLEGGFNKLKTAIGGALAIGAGIAMFDMMGKLVEKTKDYSHELTKLQNLGGGMAAAVAGGDIEKKAFDIAQRVPMKVTDLMKIPGASYSILGQEDSMKIWEPLARFQMVMQAQKDFKGDAGDDLAKFLRAGELGGRLTDPTTHKAAIEELEKFLDLSQKVMAATHGMVTPSTLLGMSQQAGFSMRGMSDEGFMNMAISAQAMGGPRAGTALLSLYNQLANGKMTPTAAKSMQDLGLLKENEWKASKGGGVIVDDSAKSRLSKLLGKNPMDFVDKIYKDLEAQGITDPAEQQRRMSSAMSRQTSQRLVGEMMMNREQIAAERGRMEQGAGSGTAFGNFANKDVEFNIKAVQSAWDNLLTSIAGPQSENLIKFMQSLTGLINDMTLSVRGVDPTTIADIGKGLAILAGALTAGGAVALLACLGPAGWMAAGILAVGAAIRTWTPGLWNGIASVLETIGNSITRFFQMLADIANKIPNFLHGFGKDAPTQVFPGGTSRGPAGFIPGEKKAAVPQVNLSLSVDGKALAQAVTEQQEKATEFPTGAPAANGWQRFSSPDDQHSDN